jgi:hypothetical protein
MLHGRLVRALSLRAWSLRLASALRARVSSNRLSHRAWANEVSFRGGMIVAMPMKRPLSLSGTIVNSTEMVAPFLWSAGTASTSLSKQADLSYIQTAPLKLDRIMVCWDGSRSAAEQHDELARLQAECIAYG